MMVAQRPSGISVEEYDLRLVRQIDSPEGEAIRTCTIITTEANELLKEVHDRVPGILPREAEAVWLDPAIQGTTHLGLRFRRATSADYPPVL